MKKQLFFGTALLCGATLFAQHANFENPVLAAESAWYGQDQITDGDTIYNSGNYNFENNYNAGWGSFSGWGFSNITDNATPGWANQYSAITGVGESGSSQYGICYVSSWEGRRTFNSGTGLEAIHGIYATNTTYAYFTMLTGDAFAKPFGADTNAQGVIDGTNGGDWFLLTIYGLGADSLYTGDSVNFYLADYRAALDVDDYIIDEWTWVDLTSLGDVKGLDFVLSSTDTTGGFGMNNPAYFAMDNLYGAFASAAENSNDNLLVYPNPTSGNFTIQLEKQTLISLYDVNGKLVKQENSADLILNLDISNLENGVYFLTSISDGVVTKQKIVKQ